MGEYGEHFQGDMIMAKEQIDSVLRGSSPRNGLINFKYRWPNATVVYEMNSSHSDWEQLSIRDAMNAIESASCVKFVERSNESYYIHFSVSL